MSLMMEMLPGADTTMTFMTFVNCDLLNAYACRSSERAFYEVGLFSNPAFLWAVGGSVIGQLLVVYFPPLQEVFQTEALSASDMMYIVFLSSSILWMDTLRKKFFASWFSDAYHDLREPRRRTMRTKWFVHGHGSTFGS
jgi:Ca2+-transporting ATPase